MKRRVYGKANFEKDVVKENGDKSITYNCLDMFNEYKVFVNRFDKNLNIKCSFIDYDMEDNVINRKVVITRKGAIHLVKDLIKFIVTGKI